MLRAKTTSTMFTTFHVWRKLTIVHKLFSMIDTKIFGYAKMNERIIFMLDKIPFLSASSIIFFSLYNASSKRASSLRSWNLCVSQTSVKYDNDDSTSLMSLCSSAEIMRNINVVYFLTINHHHLTTLQRYKEPKLTGLLCKQLNVLRCFLQSANLRVKVQ